MAHGSTVRGYQWKENAYQIERQFNPLNEHAQAFIACTYNADRKKGTMVYDSNSRNLLWYQGTDDEPKKIHLAIQESIYEGLCQLKNKKHAVLMLVGTKGIALMTDNSRVLALNEQGEYMSEAETPSLRFSRPIRLARPPRPAIAITDANNHAIEIVSYHKKNGIRHELTFNIFLRSDMVGPVKTNTTEPHDIASGDVNGDGFDDLIVLVHDKLIIYPGE